MNLITMSKQRKETKRISDALMKLTQDEGELISLISGRKNLTPSYAGMLLIKAEYIIKQIYSLRVDIDNSGLSAEAKISQEGVAVFLLTRLTEIKEARTEMKTALDMGDILSCEAKKQTMLTRFEEQRRK